MNRTLSNMFSNIKNAQLTNKTIIFQRKNKVCNIFLNILWDEGLILGFKNSKYDINYFEIFLKYNNSNINLIQTFNIIKKQNKKQNFTTKQFWKIDFTIYTLIISTSKGFLTYEQCIKKKQGGVPYLFLK